MNPISNQLTDQAALILTSAKEEARRLNHDFVGTEHLLLALLADVSGIASAALHCFGLDLPQVRSAIQELVTPGPHPISSPQIPLTPRARRAIDLALDEARIVGQSHISPEHLLLGLLREADGVAGLVLRKLGLQLERLREEVLKIRVLQMKIIERIVRPLRATNARKRTIRAELLSHLTATYQEEQDRLHDPLAATNAAAQRFGDPAELTSQLQRTLPLREVIGHHIERFFGWRAPESAARYAFRSAIQCSLLMLLLGISIALFSILRFGLEPVDWSALRRLLALLALVPIDLFLLGLLYFKMRDALFGVFGSRRSLPAAAFFSLLTALIILGTFLAFLTIATSDPAPLQSLAFCSAASALGALLYLVLARFNGPAEISDTLWACLDITP